MKRDIMTRSTQPTLRQKVTDTLTVINKGSKVAGDAFTLTSFAIKVVIHEILCGNSHR